MLNIDVITKDPDIAKKLLIGSLLAATGIGMLAILGWMMEIMRAIQRGEEPVMPDWDNIGEFFIDGLKATAVGVIWSLPVTLIVVALTLLTTFATTMFNNADDAVLLVVVLNFCIVGLIFVYLIPMFALYIPALGVLADTGEIRQAIDVRRAWNIFRANPSGILVAAVLSLAVNSVLGSIGTILCLIGIYPAFVVSYALQGQFFGKAYRDTLEMMEE